ncbi:MAG: hypothetical protein V4605_08830 [Pseudomonadota bacterium]
MKIDNDLNDGEVVLKDEEIVTKSIEQMAADARLNEAIPDLHNEQKHDEAPPVANAIDSLYGLLSLVPIGLSFAGLKHTAHVWSESTCQGLANACVPVFRKYAWGQKIINFLETGAGVEELALCAVAMPIGLATYKAIERDTYLAASDATNEAENAGLKPNPARSKQDIELANADDVKYDAAN